jgi:uncharacterized repeat protein (TIGR01451 family)
MRTYSKRDLRLTFAAALLGLALPQMSWAQAAITSPAQNASFPAEPCPVAPCTAEVPLSVTVSGPPVDTMELRLTPDTGLPQNLPLCRPPDPIEGTPGCPATPFVFDDTLFVRPGLWTAVVELTRDGAVETTAPVTFRVLAPTLAPAGPVQLFGVVPNEGAPAIRVRDASSPPPPGTVALTTPETVMIVGENLDTNPFLQVYLAPRPFGEPVLAAGSALDVDEWCLFPVEIVDRTALAGGGSALEVELPEIPLVTPTVCGATPQQFSSPFLKDWRFVIRDPWIRPERIHEWWAIPSPRPGPGHDAPPFRLVKPAYPKIDGFSFVNHKTNATYDEFLSVFGNNAYLCVGAFGLCATRVPDPLYHVLWFPIYREAVNSTGGSCAGMSATSLLMAREELQPETFEPDVHFPIGLFDPGFANYESTSICTPFCGPSRPSNLWGTIRMNHGVQISREFLGEILETLGEAVFDPNDITSVKGVPEATLQRVAADPRGYVMCFFKPGKGHCVTPDRVEGNRIWIYDNNHPQGVKKRYIDIIDGDYHYPERDGEPNHGNAIIAFPIEIWKQGRHLLGLGDLTGFGGIRFLQMLAFGSADMIATNEAGGRWGWEDDDTFTDALFGAVSIGPLGPPEADVRQMPLLLAMNQPAPAVQINADGGQYYFHASEGRLSLQIEGGDAQAGDKDRLQLFYREQALAEAEFTPQRRANHFVARAGLAIAESESAVFHWLGADVPASRTVSFGGDPDARAATYRNDTGAATHHTLMLDFGSGPAGLHGRMLYGPFEIPHGASHRVVLSNWPDVTQVRSEIDFDGDGTPDREELVTGRPLVVPDGLAASADVSIEKTVAPGEISPGEQVTYTIVVRNGGPAAATGVRLADALPAHGQAALPATTQGTCAIEASGVACDVGVLGVGDSAVVTYVVTPTAPGALANGASVSSREFDPDWTDNTAVAVADVRAGVDIRPGNASNPINLRSGGVVPIAILGTAGFDAAEIGMATLRWGPGGAPARLQGSHLQDVNRDGHADLVTHFTVQGSGLTAGDTQACVQGMTRSGRGFRGCDAVRVVPR